MAIAASVAEREGVGRGRARGRGGSRRRIAHLPWLAPVLAFATLFFLWPVLNVIYLAFTNTNLLTDRSSLTLQTISQTFSDPALPTVATTTAIFVVASVTGQLLIGLGIALIMQRAVKRGLYGAVLVRSVVLSAWVMPGILVGVVWQIVLNEAPFGLVNSFLSTFGIAPVAWLSDTKLAVVSVIVANIWRGTAFTMLLLYAALNQVNTDLYDAAKVDGARRWKTLWHITLPQIRPVLLVNVILITISTLNTFDMIIALTGGGPAQATEVLALHTYNSVFVSFNLAAGCVLAVLLLLVSLVLTLVYRRLLPDEEFA